MFISQNYKTAKPLRIISLVPSITELLHYLSLEAESVGITKFCIHPNSWYKVKTRVGGTKNLNLKIIKSLKPNLILANKEENTKEQIEFLAKEYPVFLTDVNSFEEGVEMIEHISKLTYTEANAIKLISTLKNKSLEAYSEPKIKVAYLIWKDPFMVAGGKTFIDSMLNIAGLVNVYANVNRYPVVTTEELKTSGAEAILLSTEPYPFKEKHLSELNAVFEGKKLLLADGEMFSWYGSRMEKALDYFKDFNKKLKE